MDCELCKKSFYQGGRCLQNKKNCLLYDEEPRGKMIRATFTFEMNSYAETPILKYGSKIVFEDRGKTFEVTVIKINWINLEKMTCNIDCEYHEKEMPHCEKIKMFKVINGKQEID